MKKLMVLLLVILSTFSMNNQSLAIPESDLRIPAEVIGITQAAHLRPTLKYGAEIADFNALVGKEIGFVMYFADWSLYFDNPYTGEVTFIDPYLITQIEGRFPDPATRPAIMVTWTPKNARQEMGGLPACDRDYSGAVPYNVILDGKCDPYLRGVAAAFKERPDDRILLRFAHEMNIEGSPFYPFHFGLTPADYAAAWRHIHTIFESEGVTNVEWVWSPNFRSNPDEAWNAIPLYYPGNDYVDWIGLSGYNWYDEFMYGDLPWRWFSDIYHKVLSDLTCRYPKPQMVAEVGSVHGDATLSKSSWIFDIYEDATYYPFLRAISWFNDFAFADSSAADFRITSSTAENGSIYQLSDWTSSYSNAINNSIYTSKLPPLSEATPPISYCGTGETLIVVPHTRLMTPGMSIPISITALLFDTSLPITVSGLPQGMLVGNITPSILNPPWGRSTFTLTTLSTIKPGTYDIQVIIGSLTITEIQIQVVETLFQHYLPMVALD